MNPETPRLTRRRLARTAAARRQQLRAGKTTCPATTKTRFPTWEAAVAAALRLSTTLGRPLPAYPCPDCSGGHLTRRTTWRDTP